MKFSTSVRYSAPLDTVIAMLADPSFYRTRAAHMAVAEDADISVATEGEGPVVRTRLRVKVADIDPRMSGMLPASIHVDAVESWEADRVCGTVAMSVVGVPCRLTGRMILREDEDGCVREVTGTVTASLPIVGRTIEREIVAHMDTLCAAEASAAAAYVADATR